MFKFLLSIKLISRTHLVRDCNSLLLGGSLGGGLLGSLLAGSLGSGLLGGLLGDSLGAGSLLGNLGSSSSSGGGLAGYNN